MSEARVGFPGWRGMVGSTLRDSMLANGDFDGSFEPVFFSTSEAGQEIAVLGNETFVLGNAYDLAALKDLQAIVTCQGSDYTRQVHDELRAEGWDGYWIDASSELRARESTVLALDPINGQQMEEAFDDGVRDVAGPNCVSALQLMGLAGVYRSELLERVDFTTSQAVSGAGAEAVVRLLKQIRAFNELMADLPEDAGQAPAILRRASETLKSLPTELGRAILGNLLPGIGEITAGGQTEEELKAYNEINKLLGLGDGWRLPIDGTCTRIGAFRSHSQEVSLTLRDEVPPEEMDEMIASAHKWVKLVPNESEATLDHLTPVAVSDTPYIAVGRVRESFDRKHYKTFVVGDQLIWGAAEPLRRVLKIVLERL